MIKRCFAAVEAMHAQGPLIGDKTAFQDWQKPEREYERQGRPDHRMQPDRRIGPKFFGKKHECSDDMADHENRQIRRRIVGAVMMKFFTANRADVADLEIGAKYLAFAAGRAPAAQPLADRLPCIAGGAGAFLFARCVKASCQNSGRTYEKSPQSVRDR